MSDRTIHLVDTPGVKVYATVANGPRPTLYINLRTQTLTTKVGPLSIDDTQALIDMLRQRLGEMVK